MTGPPQESSVPGQTRGSERIRAEGLDFMKFSDNSGGTMTNDTSAIRYGTGRILIALASILERMEEMSGTKDET